MNSRVELENLRKEAKAKLLDNNQKVTTYFEKKYLTDDKKNLLPNVEKKVMKDGSTFLGSFDKDKKVGHGMYSFKNGEKYMGDISASKFTGKGIYIFENGERYEGELKDG